MTNYEKIKAMSLEEMAEFMASNDGCSTCAFLRNEPGAGCNERLCKEGVKHWLEGEAEEAETVLIPEEIKK